MEYIKNLPLALSGLALAFASLGNALSAYPVARTICGIVSGIIAILIFAKLSLLDDSSRKEIHDPVTASSLINYPSALMLLSAYLPKGYLSLLLWILGLGLNVYLIYIFTRRFVFWGFRISNVYPTWFSAYIGIANGAVASPHHGLAGMGMVIFWVAFISFVPIFTLVTYRTLKHKDYQATHLPTLVNIASPCGLLLVAYMSAFNAPSLFMVYLLLILSVFFYLVALILLPRLIRLPFSPSFASFTAPFVISSSGVAHAGRFLTASGRGLAFLKPLFQFQLVLAIILCIYVLFKFIQYMGLPARNGQRAVE